MAGRLGTLRHHDAFAAKLAITNMRRFMDFYGFKGTVMRGAMRAQALLLALFPAAQAEEIFTMPDIVVQGSRTQLASEIRVSPDEERPGKDAASMLESVPGAAVMRNGGQTGIVQVRGLANERVKIRVNGLEITPACPNHMDPPLHYTSAIELDWLQVTSGATPVSMGGDSLAGTVEAQSRPLGFAKAGNRITAELEGGYAGNNEGRDFAARVVLQGKDASLGYTGSYQATEDYKFPDGTVKDSGIGSTQRHGLRFETNLGANKLEAELGMHRTRDAGTPVLPMDMIEDDATRTSVRYQHRMGESNLSFRVGYHDIDHLMDNFSLRQFSTPPGRMQAPSESRDINLGMEWQTPLAGGDLKLGIEHFANDFNVFQQRMSDLATQDIINEGKRDRTGIYADWWSPRRAGWRTNLGLRFDRVSMDAGPVATFPGAPAPVAADATAFNIADRNRADNNWDATWLTRYTLSKAAVVELGLARKTRAPSLLERYEWTPLNASAGLADGRTYLGSLSLEPEVSHQINLGLRWKGRDLSLSPAVYYNRVADYIQGMPIARLDGAGLQVLQYQNASAELYGIDAGWQYGLSDAWQLGGVVGYVRGRNRDTDDNLYRLSPLKATVHARYAQGPWKVMTELEMAARQDRTAAYNGETETPGWAIVNLLGSYRLANGMLVSAGADNLFHTRYARHLDGINRVLGSDVPTGGKMPAMGRNLYVKLGFEY
jgi:iron complex outermembrane recepter protein